MDTLARLMAHELEYIEPILLADQEESLTGQLQLEKMQRLQELVPGAADQVNFQLNFGRDSQGTAFIAGQFDVALKMHCQRCLNPVDISLKNSINIGIATSKMELQQLPDQYEPLLLTDKKLSLITFIEEEILLAIPMVPAHDIEQCPAGNMVAKYKHRKESPFAKLKDLNIKK